MLKSNSGNPQEKKQKTLMMIIGVLGVLAILFVALPMLGNQTGNAKSNIEGAIFQQNEMLRILKQFERIPQTSKGQNFLREAQAIISSNVTELEQYHQKEYQTKMDKKLAGKYTREDVVNELTKASQTNAFDQKMYEQMKILLIENKDTLKAVYEGTKKDDLKQLLEKIYNSQDTLIKQAG